MSELTQRGRSALSLTKCSDDMQDFFQVGLVRDLTAAVENLEAGAANSKVLLEEAAKQYDKLAAALERVEKQVGVWESTGDGYDAWYSLMVRDALEGK